MVRTRSSVSHLPMGSGIMALKSMTGFARHGGSAEGLNWTWEVRTVNGRGLDVRLRLPTGYDALEFQLRETIAAHCSRGNVTATLSVKEDTTTAGVRLDLAVLEELLRIADMLHARVGGAKPSVAELLSLRGVLDYQSVDPSLAIARHGPALLASFRAAMTDLVEMRETEGNRLATVIDDQLHEMTALVAEVEVAPARSPEAISRRLKDQMARLLGPDAPQLEPQRLYQEAALLATRADVDEELKRLAAHIAATRELLSAAAPVGRRLDFLTQEFNREANTLCSKANDAAITRAGLALKSVIDQMREQVQNIE